MLPCASIAFTSIAASASPGVFAGAIAGVIDGTAVGSVVPAGVAVSAFSELFFPITVHAMPAR